MSNETFWPSVKVRMPAASTAVACTKTSLPPPSGAIKPKPFEVLKNFTVPIVIATSCMNSVSAECRNGWMLEVQGEGSDCLVQARTQGGRILLQVRFVCDGSNSSGR